MGANTQILMIIAFAVITVLFAFVIVVWFNPKYRDKFLSWLPFSASSEKKPPPFIFIILIIVGAMVIGYFF